MSTTWHSDRRLIVGAAVAALVAAAGSTVGVAAASGTFAATPTPTLTATATGPTSDCSVPSLPGTVVDVTLTDMGGRMTGTDGSWGGRMPGGMMGGPMMSGHGAAGAMMRVLVTPDAAAVGTVSLRVRNTGWMTHELVILPLSDGAAVGQRGVGGDGRVDETGSVGEVSRSCGAGAGDGLAAGSTGWTTLQLPAGRYELVCNLPGHYAAGMRALLIVR
jgi:hypothetical protein